LNVTVVPDAAALAEATADRFVDAAREAIAARRRFRVALSGGSTPRAVYRLLAKPPRVDEVDWRRVDLFWGDERAVPPDHPESNFGAAYQALIAHLPGVRPEAIHRMPAEGPDLDAAARAYEGELRLAFGVAPGEIPIFDLVWLGMGPDGHVASLFPESPGLDVTDRLVTADQVPGQRARRMSLTLPLINAARRIVVALGGADKADALRAVVGGSSDLPAGRLRTDDVEWLVDAAAAGRLAE